MEGLLKVQPAGWWVAVAVVGSLAGCNRAPPEPELTPTTAAPAPREGAARPARVGASHVLVMWRGSARPREGVSRSREEARARAQEVLTRARAGEDFAALARRYSDEPGAAQSAGSLGVFGPGQMVPAFERAAFALQVGELSELVETEFGFHVIKRTQ